MGTSKPFTKFGDAVYHSDCLSRHIAAYFLRWCVLWYKQSTFLCLIGKSLYQVVCIFKINL